MRCVRTLHLGHCGSGALFERPATAHSGSGPHPVAVQRIEQLWAHAHLGDDARALLGRIARAVRR